MAASGVNTAMKRKVFVVGVGMTKFEKPGRRENFDYPDMAKEAGTKALEDAGISYDAVEQACVGYVYGDSTCGQRALYQLGMTGIPVYNVNNACATGSTALFIGKQLVEGGMFNNIVHFTQVMRYCLVNNNCATGSTALIMAKQLIEGGMADCVMALGFEKMQKGSLKAMYEDRVNPMDKHVEVMIESAGLAHGPVTAQMFGNAGREHMQQYGTTAEHFAKIAWKNHKHSTNNPYSQFQDYYTLDQIKDAPKIHDPLTKLQCCPTSDGSAAAILCSEAFVRAHNLQGQAVEILAMEMATDVPSAFKDKSCIKMVGYDMAKKAADQVYKKAGVSPDQVQVVELHDCFSCNELLTYEALGLCSEGKAGEMIDRGDNTYGGKYVINPSGGLISKGHPLGATGLAQCAELCWQLRGMANKRQVKDVKRALQHNIGLGGAAVVAMYQLGFPQQAQARLQATPASSVPAESFKSNNVFNGIKDILAKDGANIVAKMKGVFCFKVKGEAGEGVWIVDCKNGTGSVQYGGPAKGDVTIMMEDKNLVDLMQGKLNPQTAFFHGKLKIQGNTALAMKLKDLKPPEGMTNTPSAAPSSGPKPGAEFKVAPVFDEIAAELKKDGVNIVKKMKGVFCFRVKSKSGKEGIWVVDAKNGTGSVKFGGPAKGDVTILMSDDDMLNLMSGKLNPQSAFFQGKLKIQGNMGLAMKLKELQPKTDSKL